jgi:hypothetical protein
MFPIASLTTPHSRAGIPARRLLAHAVVVRLLLGWILSFVPVARLSAQLDESAPGSRSYYIDPVNGSDSANDGTYARPWKSFRNLSTYDSAFRPAKKAALAAGDCVYVMDGVITDVNYVYGTTGIGAIAYFRADWDGCRGESGKPIRIKAYPGTRPVLDAQYRGYGMMLDGCDYWDVSGITIKNAIPTIKESDGRTTCPEGGALYLVGGSHIKIHDLDIHDTKGVPGQNISSFVAKSVLDLEFYNNRLNSAKELLHSAGKVERDGGNVYLYAIDGPSKNGTLARIFHSDETGTGDHVYHHNEFSFSTSVASEGDGLGFKHGNRDLSKTVEIYGNIFRNCRAAAILTSTPNTHCYHNVMTGCGTAIASSSLGGGPGGGTFLVNQTFENNTLYNTQPNAAGEDASTGYWFGNQEPVSPANPALERQKITFRKNIIADFRSGTADMVLINAYLSDAEYNALKGEFTLTNNCYYAPNGTARFSIAGSQSFGALGAFYTDFALWQSTLGYDAGSTSGQNPLFVGAAQGNFHLAAQTPCPDAGAFPRNPADTTAPGTPEGVRVFLNDSASLFIRWSEPASWADVAGFRIYRNGTLVHDTVSTGFLDTNLGGQTDHSYTVLAYDRAGNASPVSSSATLTVAQTFAAWAAGYALSAGRNGPTDDPDADGMTNLLEYALGHDPTSVSLGLRPSVAKEGGQVVYRFTRARAVSGIALQTWLSTDLVNWTPGPALVVESATAATETCTAVLPAGQPRQFLRLDVTGP